MGAGRNSKAWTVQEGIAVSDEDFEREPYRNRFTILLRQTGHLSPMSTGAKMQTGKRRTMNMHNLVVSCLVAAYLAANVYAIVKVRVFELARSRKHLILYGVPFILWGSVILLGCKLMEIMRRFDEWAA
jgi:hypothetical protein